MIKIFEYKDIITYVLPEHRRDVFRALNKHHIDKETIPLTEDVECLELSEATHNLCRGNVIPVTVEVYSDGSLKLKIGGGSLAQPGLEQLTVNQLVVGSNPT